MKTIRHQAKVMGHDDVFYKDGIEIHFKQYLDSEGTLYAVNPHGNLAYISGDNWCI